MIIGIIIEISLGTSVLNNPAHCSTSGGITFVAKFSSNGKTFSDNSGISVASVPYISGKAFSSIGVISVIRVVAIISADPNKPLVSPSIKSGKAFNNIGIPLSRPSAKALIISSAIPV